jgi:hypothetical protein
MTERQREFTADASHELRMPRDFIGSIFRLRIHTHQSGA